MIVEDLQITESVNLDAGNADSLLVILGFRQDYEWYKQRTNVAVGKKPPKGFLFYKENSEKVYCIAEI